MMALNHNWLPEQVRQLDPAFVRNLLAAHTARGRRARQGSGVHVDITSETSDDKAERLAMRARARLARSA